MGYASSAMSGQRLIALGLDFLQLKERRIFQKLYNFIVKEDFFDYLRN